MKDLYLNLSRPKSLVHANIGRPLFLYTRMYDRAKTGLIKALYYLLLNTMMEKAFVQIQSLIGNTIEGTRI